ncbi:MAG TPA: thiamine pyrophosphate-dependent enzyme [Terriglobales bacterium]|nr:thiamine pyrophosphate-dependent enzyme [Terriglobales bacterium]
MSVPRKAWLDVLAATLGADALVVASLGANARYMPHLPIKAAHFALCDAMGAAIPLALGMALAKPERPVIALEGDGSLMMALGTLATVGAAAPRNLTILLFENHHYESSGGQDLPKVEGERGSGVAGPPSSMIDFVAVARASRVPIAERVDAASALAKALERARTAGPAFYLLPTAYDPDEAIPPYSERPDEIRLNFARRLAAR